MNNLILYLSLCSRMSEKSCDRFLETVKGGIIPKKTWLLQAGQVCDQFGFVEFGLLRSYHIWEGKEVTTRFIQEGDCCTQPESFYNQVPAKQYIQALEDTCIYYFNYPGYQALLRDFPELNASARRWLEEDQVRRDRWMEAMWMGQARDRYDWFVKKHPDLLKRISSKHLAPYLGISEVKLSQLHRP